MTPRMRVLTVLSSSNQMYSGIGRAVFELSDRLQDRVEFEFAIDDLDARNLDLVRDFAEARGIPVHVGRGRKRPEALDNGNEELAALLRRGDGTRWNASAGPTPTRTRPSWRASGDAALIFTPHHQPPGPSR